MIWQIQRIDGNVYWSFVEKNAVAAHLFGTCEHGAVMRNEKLDIEWCDGAFEQDDEKRTFHFITEQHKQNFVQFVRGQIRRGNFHRAKIAQTIGCNVADLTKLLDAAGVQWVWMPSLVSKDDKRIVSAKEFDFNQ